MPTPEAAGDGQQPRAPSSPAQDLADNVTTAADPNSFEDRAPDPFAGSLVEELPPLVVSVDGAEIASLPMGFQEWNGLSQEPAEPELLGAAVVEVGQTVAFLPTNPALLTVLIYELGSNSMVTRTATVTGPDAEVVVEIPEAGLWLLDIAARFGPSTEYSGSGVLRYGLWLRAVAPSASCEAFTSQPEQLSGVIDDHGCPVPTTLISLDLGVALPWFHCAPWPPTLRWENHPTAVAAEFWRYEFGARNATVVTMPGDAQPSGFNLGAGAIFTSPSDPEAVFVDIGAGEAERWLPPAREVGCA